LFGKVDLIENPDDYVEEHKLGPDPLDLEFPVFRERLEGRRGEIKATLMKQRVFAGIGNIYSDEILFQVRLHPKTSVGDDWMKAPSTVSTSKPGACCAQPSNAGQIPEVCTHGSCSPLAGGSGLSPGQRNRPEDEGGGSHRVLLSSVPAKSLTAIL
jgi:hypothetical protein